MSKRIAWMSRHKPLPAQLSELRRLFPGCEIVHDDDMFKDAKEIAKRIESFDEVVLVAPLSVIARLCAYGIRPLRAEMKQVTSYLDPYRESVTGNRVYRFLKFVRVVKLELITEPLE